MEIKILFLQKLILFVDFKKNPDHILLFLKY